MLGLGGHGKAIARDRLFARIDELAMAAFRDPSLRTNPRMPLVAELRELLAAVS